MFNSWINGWMFGDYTSESISFCHFINVCALGQNEGTWVEFSSVDRWALHSFSLWQLMQLNMAERSSISIPPLSVAGIRTFFWEIISPMRSARRDTVLKIDITSSFKIESPIGEHFPEDYDLFNLKSPWFRSIEVFTAGKGPFTNSGWPEQNPRKKAMFD